MVLHSFGGVGDGTKPQAGPVFGQNGALYGSTEYSLVPSGRGMVYELMPPASGSAAVPWAETILHVFPGYHSGGAPYGGVALGPNGAVYGTTFWGGNTEPEPACRSGCGTIFSLSPPAAAGGAWTANVLHRFTSLNGDGANPQSSLIFGINHMLYGTTDYGGGSAACSSCGTVFEMKP